MIWVRKSLILIHRYLGIALSLLFVVWFVSGIGMMFAGGMPSLTPQLRLERISPVDLTAIKLTVSEAVTAANLQRPPARALLLTVMERPAYRFGGTTVFADTGEILEKVGPEEAIGIASRFMNLPADKLHHELLTDIDQWTVNQARQLPLHKISVDDAAHTVLYISPGSADVGLLTTRGSRALAWVAAIPHWLYFKELRSNGALWTQVVLWTSGVGCLLAVVGITLGFMQFKFSRPFRFSRISSYLPYAGSMRWHYITGLVFGIFTLTWVFSGFLSMEPFGWAAGPGLDTGELRQAFVGGPLNLESFPDLDPPAWNQLLAGRVLKEVEYTQIQGEPYFLARTIVAGGEADKVERVRQEYAIALSDPNRLVIAANPLRIRTEPYDTQALMAQVKAAYPEVPIVETQTLTDYDSYYYSRDRRAPLPVLRVKFDDPEKTWFYIDPQMSQVVGSLHRLDRVERWIYNGFHSLDFAFWYYNAPLWQFGVILLSIGGAATSGIGLFLGVRRVIRGVKRNTGKLVNAVPRRPVVGEERQ